MSADNWRVCPKCKKDQEEKQKKAIAKAEKSYGKVSAQEYLDTMKAAAAEVDLGETLAENYSIGINEEGEFLVYYSGHCRKCSFKFEKKINEQVPLD